MDMSAIAGLASSLKAATDITGALLKLRDTALVQSKVIELNQLILTAQQHALSTQSSQFQLQERVRELEAELAHIRSVDAWRQNYELRQVHNGALVYVPKSSILSTDAPHWLCTRCFERGTKSILQNEGRDPRDKSFSHYRCNACKGMVRVFYSIHPGKDAAA